MDKYRIWVLIVCVIFLFGKNGFAQTMIIGKVHDAKTKIIVGAEITLYKNGSLIQKKIADINGNYSFKVDPGTYEMNFTGEGVFTEILTDVVVMEEQVTEVNYQFKNEGFGICGILVCQMRIQLARREKMESGQVYIEDTFKGRPNREINETIMMTPGVTISQ